MVEQYFLCECGSEFDYPRKVFVIGGEDLEVCPDCNRPIEDWMIKTYDERML